MKAKRHHLPKTPAQAMVEFALVLPILLLLVYGVIEVGRLLFIYSSIVTSARSAARYAATTGLNDAGVTPRYQDCAGMRSAARRSAFIDSLADADIAIIHDEGEGVNPVAYCTVGSATDSSFVPSSGNTNRVRITVSTQYAPIVPLVPFEAFTISSTSARTVLVSVPIAITAAPLGWNAPTNTLAPTPPQSPQTHSRLQLHPRHLHLPPLCHRRLRIRRPGRLPPPLPEPQHKRGLRRIHPPPQGPPSPALSSTVCSKRPPRTA